MNPLPLLYFPTNTLLLDDDAGFIEHVEVALEDEIPQINSFTDPQKALDFVQRTGMIGLEHGSWMQPEEEAHEEYSVSIQVQNLRHKRQDPHRFQSTTCVMIDYQMGNTNGIELCREITNPLIQKILLTGVADEKIGIEAMNNGWIHQYVRKQDPNMVNKLIAAGKRAQLQSFADLTQGLLFAITHCAEETALLDPKFINFFLNYIHTNQIVEYYLIEAMGSFLMVDKFGKQHCLFIQTKEQAESNLDFLGRHIRDPQTKNDLENNKKIICCPAPHNFITARGVNYKPYLFPAHKLEGKQVYCWAVTPNLFGNEEYD